MNTRNLREFPTVQRATRIVAIMSLFLLVQGCASLDKSECMVADWRLIGYQDGVAGKSSAAVGTYRKDCAKHAVVPDLDAYQAGRAEGLQEYCTADNGYRLGIAGRGFAAVCPSHLENGFRAAYTEGREIYVARSAVKQTHSQIHKWQQTLSHIEEDKTFKLSELISDGLGSEQRVIILYEIGKLEQEKGDVKDEIAALEHELADQQAYLDHLTSSDR